VVNMPPSLDEDDDDDGSNAPVTSGDEPGKPAAIDLADDLFPAPVGDLEL